MRKHSYNEEALKQAWLATPAAASGTLFWMRCARLYSQIAGRPAPALNKLQQAANRRGYRARLSGSSRSTSRWGKGPQRLIIQPEDRAAMAMDARGRL